MKDILAYLQVVDNPSFNPALVRAVKVPSRGMGDKVRHFLSPFCLFTITFQCLVAR